MSMQIRAARPDDATALTELALQSKASWGYDDAFMATCRDNLTVTTEAIATGPTFVAEKDGLIAGFYRLDVAGKELDSMFVRPAFLRTGVGRALWDHCVKTAANAGLTEFAIASDPYAEPFYVAMGAVREGEILAPSTGRMLPLLRATV